MLRYTGGGFGGSLPGLPARDLADQEVLDLGGEADLIATGLYVRPSEAPRKKQQKEAYVANLEQEGPADELTG